MNSENTHIRGWIAMIALVGSIGLGVFFTDARVIALGNCGVAIGGYLGQLNPNKKEGE